MNANKLKIYCFVIAASALIIDRVSKSSMMAFMDSREGRELTIIPGFFSLVSSWNTGVAFGMLQGASPFILLAPVGLVIVLLGIFLFSGPKSFAEVAGAALIAGGALGNMIDRVRGGRVYDFLDFYIASYHWPTFNAADIFIVTGAFLFGIMLLRNTEK